MKKFNAFTLAEVLITLGIIGVVAAMTMPTLMNSTNGAQYKTAYKKALSVLSQAVVLNVALDDYDLSQATEADDTKAVDGTSPSLYNLFTNRMNVVNTVVGAEDATDGWASGDAKFGAQATNNYTLFFNDGITFTFKKDTECTLNGDWDGLCFGVIDVNGEKNPNKIVTCHGKEGTDVAAQHDANCTVENPTDIYPVVMYDQTILPNSDAGRAVLYGAGS